MADQEVKTGATSVDTTSDIKPEWTDRRAWEIDTRVSMRVEYEKILEVWKATELKALEEKNELVIKEGLEKYFVKWKEEQKPT